MIIIHPKRGNGDFHLAYWKRKIFNKKILAPSSIFNLNKNGDSNGLHIINNGKGKRLVQNLGYPLAAV